MTPLTTLEFAAQSITVGITALTTALALRNGSRTGRLLAAFFGTLGLSMFASAVLTGWHAWLPSPAVRWLQVINVAPVYLTGPLLYAYTSSLLPGGIGRRRGGVAWHFVPAVLVGLFMLTLAIWPGVAASGLGGLMLQVIVHAWVAITVPYLAFSAWQLRDAPRWLEEVSADEASLRISWLRHLVTVIAVLWLVVGLERISVALSSSTWHWPGAVLSVVMIVVTYLLAWSGLRLGVLIPAGMLDHQDLPAPSAEAADPAARYLRSGLSEPERAQIAADLGALMREHRLHLDNELDLARLSERSGWSPNYISQALNQQLGQNFFEFVNGFRIADAKRCLADPGDPRSVLDIALACGFGSKSTFNTVFKRLTGLTPTAFRRRAMTSDPAGLNDPVV
ncbi:AraC family transcriptional regulator [Stenotrophomonas sp.]|uniref:helix-turn-helix domain-containing protein n=1 Tax=Stenotrophomonas sp. TaxID=69392 RepID=UPI0028A0178C|nr:AraC family transcriptional regulator [Stenotrophomonas sp.]